MCSLSGGKAHYNIKMQFTRMRVETPLSLYDTLAPCVRVWGCAYEDSCMGSTELCPMADKPMRSSAAVF